mgnify:CR=1 FL=1
MSDNVISFMEYLEKNDSRHSIDENLIESLTEDIKNKPELIEWYSFESSFNKHKLFLSKLFASNQAVDAVNPNAGFIACFSEEQIADSISKILEAIRWLNKDFVHIDADKCTFKGMAEQISGAKPKRSTDAWIMLEELLLKTDKVVVISNISNSKIPSKKSWHARSVIKINDDAHLRGIRPRSEIVFVDHACFLQRSWSELGAYIDVLT